MTIEQFINKYDFGCGGDCDDQDACDRRHPEARAALAELAELREQVKTARLEGARKAWLIAHMDDSTRAAYRDAFGEDAPMATDQATFGEEAP